MGAVGTVRRRQAGASAMLGAVAATAWMGGRSAAAATYVWNNTGPAWETGSDYTPTAPTGGPTSTDAASFDPTVAAATVMNPVINASNDSAGTLSLNDDFLGTTYTFTGAGLLTVGNAANASGGSFGAATFNVPTGVITRGFGTTTFNGPTLAGATPNGLTFNIGSASGFTLAGNTTALTNAGQVTLLGALTLDNTGTNTPNRLSTAAPITINGGTLAVLGNVAGGTVNVGPLNVSAGAGNPGEGLATISVNSPTNATGQTTLNFNNAAGSISLRTTTAQIYDFVAANGATLGTATGPQVKFGAATVYTTNGLISNNSANTVGFAIVTDATGTNFATYNATTGVTAATTTAAAAATSLTSATTNYAYNDSSGSDATTSVIGNSIKISPTSAGSSLNLTANGSTGSTAFLQTQALMLSDPANNDTFTINASSGVYVGNATKIVYVTNPTTTLATNSVFFAGTNPVDIVGPGFVSLTASTAQYNTGYGATRINLVGGTLRVNSTQLGLTSAATQGAIAFRGGVLEITGGSDGTGSGADFTRIVNGTTTAGEVNWASATSGDSVGGSGGFSAFGANASVNLGGSATPTGLTWGVPGSGFVQDGEQLIFGSTQSNARLDFLNPIALDGGAAGAYDARAVQVIGGAGGDSTNLAGAITGSASTDLVKTGTGKLLLTGANTYGGRTLVEGGTLLANSSSGAGIVTIASGGTVGGTGTLTGGVLVTTGGTITAGSGATATDSIGTLNVAAANFAGGTYVSKLNGAASDELIISSLTMANSSAGQLIVSPIQTGTSPVGVTRYVIADDTTSATAFVVPLATQAIALTPTATASGDTLTVQPDGTGEDLVLTAAATPEPTSLLLLGVAAAPLVIGRRRRDTREAAAEGPAGC